MIQAQTGEGWIAEVTTIAKMINGLIAHRKQILPDRVRESQIAYDATDDPFLSES